MPSAGIKIEITEAGKFDEALSKMPINLRIGVVEGALRAAGKIVAEAAAGYLPGPGYKGDKDPNNELRKSIGVRIKSYPNTTVAFVGPRKDSKSQHKGGHGHLVEFGHEVTRSRVPDGKKTKKGTVVGSAKPRPFMRPAADGTKAQQQAAIVGYMQRRLRELLK